MDYGPAAPTPYPTAAILNPKPSMQHTDAGGSTGSPSSATIKHRARVNLLSFARRLLPKRVPVALKLALAMALLITLAMSLLGTMIVYNQTRLLREQIRVFGQTLVQQVAESAREPLLADDTLSLQILANNLAEGEGLLGAAIFAAGDGTVIRAGLDPFQLGAPYEGKAGAWLKNEPSVIDWRWTGSPLGEIRATTFVHPVRFQDLTAGHVALSFSRGAMSQSLREAIKAIVATTALVIVLGVVASYFMGRRLSRPIHDLVDASRAIRDGRYGYRINERRNDEIGLLMSVFNNMAAGLLEKNQVEAVFSRYVSPRVAKEILADLDNVELGGKHVKATVLFADIVGFTSLSENLAPGDVATLLNDYFSHITRAAESYNGTVDKFIGDCAMLVFGVPEEDPDHVFNAIACAVLIQRLVEALNVRRRAFGQLPIHFRLGVNSGDMLAGNMGSNERMQYTVVGDAVNLASRLCSIGEAGEIVITEEVYRYPGIQDQIIAEEHGAIRLRGKTEKVSTYLVQGLTPAYHNAMTHLVDRILGPARETVA
jgi:adenylate cyclase